MSAIKVHKHDDPEGLTSLPAAATTFSPLDDQTHRRAPLSFASRPEIYVPRQTEDHSQTSIDQQQPLIPPHNPNRFNNTFGDSAETASIVPSVATQQSALPNYASATRYGIHRNEEEYLAALRKWADEQQYVQGDAHGILQGFYGNEELKDRAERMRAERKAEKELKARLRAERKGIPVGDDGLPVNGGRRKSSISQFFRRQSNAA